MTTVVADLDPLGNVVLRWRYDAELVELVKTVVQPHHRTFDPTDKTWTVDHVLEALAFLQGAREAGHHVIGEDKLNATFTRDDPPPRSAPPPGGDWAERLFDAVGPQLADAAYRALSRIVHPDVGGSTELQQALNRAHSRRGATQ